MTTPTPPPAQTSARGAADSRRGFAASALCAAIASLCATRGALAAPGSLTATDSTENRQMTQQQGATPTAAAAADTSAVRPAQGYAGDISPQLAWQWVQTGQAVLIDVRSDAEREWVGQVPGAIAAAWKQWPGMALDPDFDAQLRAAVPAGGRAVLLCRSGVRSIAAARRAAELGISAYNILEGFEGDADAQGQRGKRGGWRFHGLPWRQN